MTHTTLSAESLSALIRSSQGNAYAVSLALRGDTVFESREGNLFVLEGSAAAKALANGGTPGPNSFSGTGGNVRRVVDGASAPKRRAATASPATGGSAIVANIFRSGNKKSPIPPMEAMWEVELLDGRSIKRNAESLRQLQREGKLDGNCVARKLGTTDELFVREFSELRPSYGEPPAPMRETATAPAVRSIGPSKILANYFTEQRDAGNTDTADQPVAINQRQSSIVAKFQSEQHDGPSAA